MLKKSSSSVQVFYPRSNKEMVIKHITEKLHELEKALPVCLVVLFGSYAKGNYNVSSDIDLLVAYRGEKREDAYKKIRKIIDLPGLEPHVYTEKEYMSMKKTIEKMIKGGFLIYSSP
jgi:predicted nucleotidyltransferase